MRARAVVLALAVPAAAVVVALTLGPWPLVAIVAVVWALFLFQAFSGRSAWGLVRYGRLRRRLIAPGEPGRSGERRSIEGPSRPDASVRVAWSHDGWAHADGHLLGLDLLDPRFAVTAFGTESRSRGTPPVALELLPAIAHDDGGITLAGLTDALMQFDVAWVGGSYEGTTLQALDARAAGGPAVVCYEVENVVANYGHVRHPIRERALREVDHFCAISSGAAAVLELDGVEPERISLVPPVVETPQYTDDERDRLRAEGRSRWGLGEDDFVVLFMGRAVWEKGLHTVAAAAATLWSEGSAGARWLVAGEGDYVPEAERILSRYGASDAVCFAGPVGGEDRHRAYAAADALVLPSLPTPRWLEQFGRVIPEAFAFGLPVIGSASGAIPEVVGDAGIVVPPADHLALADAVTSLMEPRRYSALAAAAEARLAAEYSPERFASRIERALDRALGHRAAAGRSGG